MIRLRGSALIATMALFMCFSAAAAVKVEGGLVEGTAEEGLTVYRGIPFAAPPMGDLRWRSPQPAVEWEGVLKVDRFAPMCMQNMPGMPAKPPGDIRQSGGSFGPPRKGGMPGENMQMLADAELDGESLAREAGASSIAELRSLPVEKISAVSRTRGMAWPIIDGWVIPDDQYKLYAAGQYNDTPILVGYNSDEGLSFSPPDTPADYIDTVRKRYGPFADRLLKAYPTGADKVPKSARDLARDSAFGWHTWIWARLQSQNGKSKVFFYYFDQHPDYPADSPRAGHGTPHGADVSFVFQHLNPSGPTADPTDPAISEAMAAYWTNFAKRGDPNGDGVPKWDPFSDTNPVVMHFAKMPHPGPVPSEGGLKTLDAYFAWRRTPEGQEAVK